MDFYHNPFISTSKEVQNLVLELHKSRFSIKDSQLSYRALNHYQKEGIIDANKNPEGSWRKFNAIELVWIKIVLELRKLGISLKKILRLKDKLFNEGRLGSVDKAQFINNSFDVEIALAIYNKYDLFLVIFSDYNCTFHDSQSSKQWFLKLYKEEPNINIPLNNIINEVFAKIRGDIYYA